MLLLPRRAQCPHVSTHSPPPAHSAPSRRSQSTPRSPHENQRKSSNPLQTLRAPLSSASRKPSSAGKTKPSPSRCRFASPPYLVCWSLGFVQVRTPLWCRVPLVVDSLACVQSCNVAHGHDLSPYPGLRAPSPLRPPRSPCPARAASVVPSGPYPARTNCRIESILYDVFIPSRLYH